MAQGDSSAPKTGATSGGFVSIGELARRLVEKAARNG